MKPIKEENYKTQARRKTMAEFNSLEEDMIKVFKEVHRVKEKYGISSISIESNKYLERFHGSHGGKRNFMGEREHRYAIDSERHFMQIK